jgi:hypothetical protein
MTNKQKTLLATVAVVLAALWYGPSIIMSVRQFSFNREHAAQIQAQMQEVPAPKEKRQPRAAAVAVALDTAAVGVALDTAAVAVALDTAAVGVALDTAAVPFPLKAVSGFWLGTGVLKSGFCTVHLELRENPQAPGHLLGFPSIACIETTSAKLGGVNLAITAILDGAWDKPNLDFPFRVIKSISPDNCPITKFTLTPMGSNLMTAEWQEGICQSGVVQMQRTNR